MKKFFSTIAASVICAATLSAQAFAADILSDRSVYAANRESIASSAGSMEWHGETVTVDPNTLTPLYYVDFYDYARTGIFDVQPYLMGEYGQNYMSDAVNSSGDYAGEIELTVNGSQVKIHTYWHTTDRVHSLSFTPNAKRISALMAAKNIGSDCKEVKLVYINEIVHVYYIDNGESKLLAATGMWGVSSEVFNEENGGIVEINDDLKAIADRMLGELGEYKSLGDAPKLFYVDNTLYMDESSDKPANNDNENPPLGGGGSVEPSNDDGNTPLGGGSDEPSNDDGNPPLGGGGTDRPSDNKGDNPSTGVSDEEQQAETAKRMIVLGAELFALFTLGIGIAVVKKSGKNN